MRINRKIYLDRLISRIGNGMIKVVTGVRRSGKSYLLFNIFSDYLKLRGTDDSHIIAIKLDDWENHALCDPDSLYSYVKSRIVDNKEYFLLLDEIQLVPQFEFVLNGLHSLPCVDIYVTGLERVYDLWRASANRVIFYRGTEIGISQGTFYGNISQRHYGKVWRQAGRGIG